MLIRERRLVRPIKSDNGPCRDDFVNNGGYFIWQKRHHPKAPDRNPAAARKGTVRAAGQAARRLKAAASAAEERRTAAEARHQGRAAGKALAPRGEEVQKPPPAPCRNGRLALARRRLGAGAAPTPAGRIHAANPTFEANRR